ncbi:MAG: hypothetical protein HKN26_16805 [Acidimicrobiales bacterium]|nr:hypothetical protein [Acidimicrobiales bacterium]
MNVEPSQPGSTEQKWSINARRALLRDPGPIIENMLDQRIADEELRSHRLAQRRLAADVRSFADYCEQRIGRVVKHAEETVTLADSLAMSDSEAARRRERELILKALDIDAVQAELEELLRLFEQLR